MNFCYLITLVTSGDKTFVTLHNCWKYGGDCGVVSWWCVWPVNSNRRFEPSLYYETFAKPVLSMYFILPWRIDVPVLFSA